MRTLNIFTQETDDLQFRSGDTIIIDEEGKRVINTVQT